MDCGTMNRRSGTVSSGGYSPVESTSCYEMLRGPPVGKIAQELRSELVSLCVPSRQTRRAGLSNHKAQLSTQRGAERNPVRDESILQARKDLAKRPRERSQELLPDPSFVKLPPKGPTTIRPYQQETHPMGPQSAKGFVRWTGVGDRVMEGHQTHGGNDETHQRHVAEEGPYRIR